MIATGAFDAFEDRNARRESIRENTSRHAWTMAHVTTTGWGEVRIADRIDFGMTFIEKPLVTYGYAVDDDTLVETRFPRSFGFVARWDTNKRGHYTGCWVALVVDTQSAFLSTDVTEEPNYALDHYFVFMGIGMKNVPASRADL